MGGPSTNKRAADSGSPKNRRSTGSTSPATPQRSTVGDANARPRKESPFKRVKRAIEQDANKPVIDTADDLKAFIAANDPAGLGVPSNISATIALRMRLVWTSFETWNSGAVARLHLIDNHVDETVEELQSVLKAAYSTPTQKAIVDAELVTASLYGVEAGNVNVPEDGATVRISKMWSMKLFSKQSCQLSTSLDYVKIESN